jgi:transcriptional regulator with XRE-family HTH domain
MAMHMSVPEMRELLATSASQEIPALLKGWRDEASLSQAEAAALLGVSVRTLQGWELGRPMPYPQLIQHAVEVRRGQRFGLVQSEFPKEFAEFIDFVGGNNLDGALRKVERKLAPLSPQAQSRGCTIGVAHRRDQSC